MVVAYEQVPVLDTTATPPRYNENRMISGEVVVTSIRDSGGLAVAIDAELLDAQSAHILFDFAEESLGPVDILVNNAWGWLRGDSFVAGRVDDAGRTSTEVNGDLIDRTFGVDARAGALLIAEFAHRYLARGATWGRIVALTSGEEMGSPVRSPTVRRRLRLRATTQRPPPPLGYPSVRCAHACLVHTTSFDH